MKIENIKSLFWVSIICGVVSTPILVSADDNIAACEIVIMQAVTDPDEKETDAMQTELTEQSVPMMATFLPADDFIYSVFGGKNGHLTEVDGKPIRAIMCTRSSVIPTEFDEKLIQTGIPLHLSQNFDSPDSALMSINKQDGKFVHNYSGDPLSADDKEMLQLRLKHVNTAIK